ncbi:MAG: phytanoyl-CoA dioxygenase family protein [Planctomycetota bacterium]|nr:phytanoyl-CoA dioxygenase family protein [Planctomycetota bacterium]
MQLSSSQIQEFQDRGLLFLPSLLPAAQVADLQATLPQLLRRPGPEVVREKNQPDAARLVFGPHHYDDAFRRLSLSPRLLHPVQQLLGEDVYLHQSRLNPKSGFGHGESWAWHQDYPPWHTIDGMPQPRCIMASVFLDDCTTVNSPLLVLPGSHRHGLLSSQLHKDADGRGYELHHLATETLRQLADQHGIEPLIGPAGSVAFVHCNLVHGSANNVSPWRRAIAYLIYNAVSNACTKTERPWYQNERDFSPLRPLPEPSC